MYVILCSGRGTKDTKKISQMANASPIVISDNGANIYNYDENKIIYQSKIDFKAVQEIWDFAINNDINITLNSICNRYKSYNSAKDAVIINSLSEISDNDCISELVVDSCDYDSITSLKNFIEKNYSKLESRNFWSRIQEDGLKIYEMDILNKGNDKGNALKTLLDYLDIKKEEAICFGDQLNDLGMFRNCKLKIAMCNGCEELKSMADFVTDYSNDEDGVAKWINKLINRDKSKKM